MSQAWRIPYFVTEVENAASSRATASLARRTESCAEAASWSAFWLAARAFWDAV
jgi:hypothetical protein